MKLTRRDAIAALAAAGVAVSGGTALTWRLLREEHPDRAFDEDEVATLVAAARTVYPSVVDGIPAFVERYVVGRLRDRPEHAGGVREALETLDRYATAKHDVPFRDLAPDRRDALLRSIGIDQADPDPEGTDASRLRFFLLNELQYALYTTPTGGKLVGIENPQGYPGGTTSYRRGPDAT